MTALRHEEGAFAGVGGPRIFWQSWTDDAAEARAAVVVAHGAGEHGGRYARLAASLAPRGFPVTAIDHRGHGRSEGRRGLVDRLAHAVADLDHVVGLIGARLPVVLLGHSAGGAMALLHALSHQERLAGLVLTGPGASDVGSPPAQRIAARVPLLPSVLSALAPGLPLVAFPATGQTSDPAEVRAYLDDPLVYSGRMRARTAIELSRAVTGPLAHDLGRLTLPILLLHGGDDHLVSPRASEHVRASVGSADVRLQVLPGLRHAVLHEIAAGRDRATAEIVAWLDARFSR